MAEQYTKVEIIKPPLDSVEALGEFAGSLVLLAFRVLIVWWAVAAWFPELGITYWQIILPVCALRVLVTNRPTPWRQLKK